MLNFVVPEIVLWDNVATKPRNEIGTALNQAKIAIERANEPKFDGIRTNASPYRTRRSPVRVRLAPLGSACTSALFLD